MNKPGKQKKYSTMERREARNFYLYTAPWLIGFLVLTLYPILYSFYLMFTDMNLSGIANFVGLENWKYAFTDDPLFRKDILLEQVQIVSTPGSGFGPHGEGYLRLTAFGSRENTIRAVERIKTLQF